METCKLKDGRWFLVWIRNGNHLKVFNGRVTSSDLYYNQNLMATVLRQGWGGGQRQRESS